MKFPAFSSLASLLLLAPAIACATATTVQITGTGQVCDFSQNCVDNLALTGSIQLTTVGGPDDSWDGVEASGFNWVQMSVELQWSGVVSGSYTSALAGATSSCTHATVRNDYPYFTNLPPADNLVLQSFSEAEMAGVIANKTVVVERMTTDASWLNSLAFSTLAGLAPGADGQNHLFFGDAHATLSDDGSYLFSPDSAQGNFTLTSWTVSAVPEPANWALFGLGCVALLGTLQRRRRPQD